MSLDGLKGATQKLQQNRQVLGRGAIAKGNEIATDKNIYLVDWLLGLSLSPWSLSTDFLLGSQVPDDRFSGMGSVYFPFLGGDGTVDTGLWCHGCWHHKRERRRLQSPFSGRLSTRSERQARTKFEFLEHIIRCEGAKSLFNKGVYP